MKISYTTPQLSHSFKTLTTRAPVWKMFIDNCTVASVL